MSRLRIHALLPLFIVLAALSALFYGCAALKEANPCASADPAYPEEFGFCSVQAGTKYVTHLTNLATEATTPPGVADSIEKVVRPLVDALDDLSDATEEVGKVRKQVAAGTSSEDELVIALQILAASQDAANKASLAAHTAEKGDSP